MPPITGENNYLDRGKADQTAARLKSLFDVARSDMPAVSADSVVGSPHLVDSLAEAPPHVIEPYHEAAEIYAIDGGSSILARGGNIEVMAWRAGMVRFHDRKRVTEYCPPPEILAYNRLEGADIFEEYMIDMPVRYNPEKPPLRPVDDLRWLAEWRLIKNIVEEAESQALLLIDGSLRANPAFGIDFQREILRLAAHRQVHVAAVTKQSSLSLSGSLPLDLIEQRGKAAPDGYDYWYRKLNRPLDENSGWLGNIYLAGLHPGADKPYRVDINRFDETNTDKIFALIAAVSDDVEFCGYPYPLAAAHRLARIDNLFRQEMIDAVGQALERSGFAAEIWEYLTGDIHEKLNADMAAREEANG